MLFSSRGKLQLQTIILDGTWHAPNKIVHVKALT